MKHKKTDVNQFEKIENTNLLSQADIDCKSQHLIAIVNWSILNTQNIECPQELIEEISYEFTNPKEKHLTCLLKSNKNKGYYLRDK